MAAPTDIVVKLDLYGSYLTLGVDSNRRDRALRKAHVRGLEASVEPEHTLKQRAAQAVFAVVGKWHNTITDLLLQDIQVVQHGTTQAWVDLIYFRGFENTGFLDGPLGGTYEYTRKISGVLPVYRHTTDMANGDPAFDSHGLPAGPMLGNAPDRLKLQNQMPTWKMWKREATLISVPTVLASHPYSIPGVAALLGHVNSDDVTIGSINFAPFTLKFETADVSIRFGGFGVGPGSVQYDTLYQFIAIDGGHYHQTPVWNASEEEWETIEAVEFPALPFVGQFPLGP